MKRTEELGVYIEFPVVGNDVDLLETMCQYLHDEKIIDDWSERGARFDRDVFPNWGIGVKQPDSHRYAPEFDDELVYVGGYSENFISDDSREDLIDLFCELSGLPEVGYVFGIHELRRNLIKGAVPEEVVLPSPVSEDGLAQHRIDHPTWLMIFPPAMVEEYGREWLLNLPVDRVEELDHGGILVIATDDFETWTDQEELMNNMRDAVEPLEEAFEARHAEL